MPTRGTTRRPPLAGSAEDTTTSPGPRIGADPGRGDRGPGTALPLESGLPRVGVWLLFLASIAAMTPAKGAEIAMPRFLLIGALFVTAVAGAVAPARATFKGTNGLLVYQAQAGDHVQLF